MEPRWQRHLLHRAMLYCVMRKSGHNVISSTNLLTVMLVLPWVTTSHSECWWQQPHSKAQSADLQTEPGGTGKPHRSLRSGEHTPCSVSTHSTLRLQPAGQVLHVIVQKQKISVQCCTYIFSRCRSNYS